VVNSKILYWGKKNKYQACSQFNVDVEGNRRGGRVGVSCLGWGVGGAGVRKVWGARGCGKEKVKGFLSGELRDTKR